MDDSLLEWGRKLQAIAQTGLAFTENPFDRERFEKVQRIAAEILSSVGNMSVEALLSAFRNETGYATPKVGVRGAVFRDDAILLVHERTDNLWSLPGGWVDVGDTPREAIEREILEESGFLTRASKLVGVYDRRRHGHPPFPHHVFILAFECTLVGGASTGSVETFGAGFFRENELPPLSQPRTPTPMIERLFFHHRNRETGTDFD